MLKKVAGTIILITTIIAFMPLDVHAYGRSLTTQPSRILINNSNSIAIITNLHADGSQIVGKEISPDALQQIKNAQTYLQQLRLKLQALQSK